MKPPPLDRKWLRDVHRVYGHKSQHCLGCEGQYDLSVLRKHEKECVRNRDRIEHELEEDIQLLKARVQEAENERDELDRRVDIQEETIDELEQESDVLREIIRTHQVERTMYNTELGVIERFITPHIRPLQLMATRLGAVASSLSRTRQAISGVRTLHRNIERRRRSNDLSSDNIMSFLAGPPPPSDAAPPLPAES
jgi:chromosome segregation ATPase